MERLNRLVQDETGAETAEIIVSMVILVISVVVGFAILRDAMREQLNHSADCINEAVDLSECG